MNIESDVAATNLGGSVGTLIGGEALKQYEKLAALTGSMNPGVSVKVNDKDIGEFVVKDSGKREEFDSGMRRDTEDGKPDFTLIRKGPMFKRWAEHLTKGAVKYGRHNWTKANSMEEYERFQRSAARHFEQWLAGERDEDHGAAVMFNINAAEYVLECAF